MTTRPEAHAARTRLDTLMSWGHLGKSIFVKDSDAEIADFEITALCHYCFHWHNGQSQILCSRPRGANNSVQGQHQDLHSTGCEPVQLYRPRSWPHGFRAFRKVPN